MPNEELSTLELSFEESSVDFATQKTFKESFGSSDTSASHETFVLPKLSVQGETFKEAKLSVRDKTSKNGKELSVEGPKDVKVFHEPIGRV